MKQENSYPLLLQVIICPKCLKIITLRCMLITLVNDCFLRYIYFLCLNISFINNEIKNVKLKKIYTLIHKY